MTIESRLDVETQHPKWQGVAKIVLTERPDPLTEEALIKSAIIQLADLAKRETGPWPQHECHSQTIIKQLGSYGTEDPDNQAMVVAARIIKIHVDQQPFTTWDKLFARLVWGE